MQHHEFSFFYRKFEIRIYSVYSPRFGKLYGAVNNSGEPKTVSYYHKKISDAILDEISFIDQYLKESGTPEPEMIKITLRQPTYQKVFVFKRAKLTIKNLISFTDRFDLWNKIISIS